jgi:hypothetical protein
MGHDNATKHTRRDAYASLFIDFDTMNVTTRWGHQTGNDAPIARPVFSKLTEPMAYEDQNRALRG